MDVERVLQADRIKEKRLDRRYSRWNLMFSTMMVFVSITMPLLLKAEIKGNRVVLVCLSLVSAFLCLAALATLLFADEREMREVENRLLCSKTDGDYISAKSTRAETWCRRCWKVFFVSALILMFASMFV